MLGESAEIEQTVDVQFDEFSGARAFQELKGREGIRTEVLPLPVSEFFQHVSLWGQDILVLPCRGKAVLKLLKVNARPWLGIIRVGGEADGH